MAKRTAARCGFFIEAIFGDLGGPGLRVVIPKSVHKSAARRNALRRQIQEWSRRRFGPLGAPARLTIRLSRDALSLARQSRYDLLAEQFTKLGL